MQIVTALVTVIAAASWIGLIAGVVFTLADPSLRGVGVLGLSALITAGWIALAFRLLEHTHGAA